SSSPSCACDGDGGGAAPGGAGSSSSSAITPGNAPAPGSWTSNFSDTSVRYANGEVRMLTPELLATGFGGQQWGHTRSYSNRLDSNYQGANGDRWFVKEMPQLGQDPS